MTDNVTWSTKKLGDIAKLQYGKAKPKSSSKSGTVPFYGSGGIDGFTNEKFVEKDAIIIGRKGSVGSIYYAKNSSWPLDTAYYTFGSENVNLKFLYYLLPNVPFVNMDTVKPGLNREYAESIEIKLPNLEYQNNVVKNLDIFEQKVLNIEKLEQLLTNYITKIFEHYFLDFNILKNDTVNLVKKGRLTSKVPEIWDVQNFYQNSLFTINTQSVKPFEGSKRYVDTRSIQNNSINNFELTNYEEKKSRANLEVRENSILFAKMTNSVKHYFFMENSKKIIDNSIFSTGFINIVPNEDSFEYVAALTMNSYFEKKKNNIGSAKTSQQAINNDELKLIDLIIPDKKSLEAFKKLTTMHFKKLESIRNEKMEIKDVQNKLTRHIIEGTISL